MKITKLIGHPFLLIAWFSCIIIIGEHYAAPYIFYMVLGLTHGVIHSVIGTAGILLLLLNTLSNKVVTIILKGLINCVGALLLSLSLWLFFYNDIYQYNYQTLHQTVTLSMLAGFVLLAIFFFGSNLVKVLKRGSLKRAFDKRIDFL